MGLPCLKIQSEEALRLLDRCVVAGYQTKDAIISEYLSDQRNVTNEKITQWSEESKKWADETIQTLAIIFVSSKESYNFRDAPTSALYRDGTNAKWNGIVNLIESRIQKLNEYVKDIRTNFNMQIEIIGRDKIMQLGNDGNIEICN